MRQRLLHFAFIALLALMLQLAACAETVTAEAKSSTTSGPFTLTQYFSKNALMPGDEFEIALEFTMDEGLHTGAASKDAAYPAKLTVDSSDNVEITNIRYQKPEIMEIMAMGGEVPVYHGTIYMLASGKVSSDAKPGDPIEFSYIFEFQSCDDMQCFPPEDISLSTTVDVSDSTTDAEEAHPDIFTKAREVVQGDPDKGSDTSSTDLASKLENSSLFIGFIAVYLAGLLLGFTPCVYPMIPVTIGFFQMQSEKNPKKVVGLAGIYILGLALTYSIIGVIAAMSGKALGEMTQRPEVQVAISLILVALAMSMFGLYDIKPPAFIANRSAGKSGAAGALMMGMVFGIVAAPCAGPAVLALMLHVAELSNVVTGFVLFFALSLGIGTPLFFLAAFSGSLPVPGLWMVTVKKLAGFLLLGAAAYYMQTVVPYPVRLYLIPAVVLAGGIYFTFLDKSLKSSKALSLTGRLLGIISLLSAGFLVWQVNQPYETIEWQPYSADKLIEAADENRPVIIDFTADWCAACQELKHITFADSEVIEESTRFVRLKVDATDTDAPDVQSALKAYNVKGLPTIIFIGSDGAEMDDIRTIGFTEPDIFLERMKKVK